MGGAMTRVKAFVKNNYEQVVTGFIGGIFLAVVLGAWSVVQLGATFNARATAVEQQLSSLVPKVDHAVTEVARLAGALEQISQTRRTEIEFYIRRAEDIERRVRKLEVRKR